MFAAYLDASGTEHDQPVLAVAGFLALAEEWLAFELVWRERLSRDGLAYFHMREINREYKGDSAGRRRLLEDLARIIGEHVTMKVGCCVVNEGLNQIPDTDRKRWYLNAYSLTGRSCAAQIRIWANGWSARFLPLIVFEEGDTGSGELTKILQRDGFGAPSFVSKTDRKANGASSRGATPLEAADLFAYAVFESCRKIEQESDIQELPWLLDVFRKIPGVVRHIGAKDLDDLLKRLEMPEL